MNSNIEVIDWLRRNIYFDEKVQTLKLAFSNAQTAFLERTFMKVRLQQCCRHHRCSWARECPVSTIPSRLRSSLKLEHKQVTSLVPPVHTSAKSLRCSVFRHFVPTKIKIQHKRHYTISKYAIQNNPDFFLFISLFYSMIIMCQFRGTYVHMYNIYVPNALSHSVRIYVNIFYTIIW